MIVGPTQFTFMYWELRGSPILHISSPRIAWRHGEASRPPYSVGQCCVSQPLRASFGQNSFENSACASLPGPCFESSAQSAGSASARNSRSSRRKAMSSSDQRNSTPPPARRENLTVYQILREGNRISARPRRETRFPSSPRMVYLRCMPFPDFTPTIPTFVRTRSERFGARPLILLRDERITYAQADERSARLARGLLAAGARQGQPRGALASERARLDRGLPRRGAHRRRRDSAQHLLQAARARLGDAPRRRASCCSRCRAFLNADYLERLEAVAPALAHAEGRLAARARASVSARRVYVFGRSGSRLGAARRLARGRGRRESRHRRRLPARDRELRRARRSADRDLQLGQHRRPEGRASTRHGTLIRHAFNLNSFRDLRADDRIFSPMPFFWVGGLVFTLMAAMHAGAFMLCEEVLRARRDARPARARARDDRRRLAALLEGDDGAPELQAAATSRRSAPETCTTSCRPSVRPKDPELRSNSLGMTETCGPHTIDRMDVDRPESLRGSFGRSGPRRRAQDRRPR